MSKVMSLHDAVEKFVHDGDAISLGGFTTNRKLYAVVHEILCQGQKDFVVYAGPAGGDWDMLIGQDRVKAYINCYTANSGYTNVARRFRKKIEDGTLVFEDYSQDAIMLMLHAASLGLPYLLVRLMMGSDRSVAKRAHRLALGRPKRLFDVLFALDHAHTASAAAGCGFNDDGIVDFRG